ncbi:Zinc finger B-box domain-containing protein 1, partial [Nibea albiflora]
LSLQVVSSDSASSVICWLADTGQKVWDFNGRCLHRMNAGLGQAVEISQVLLLKRSILAMGWERYCRCVLKHLSFPSGAADLVSCGGSGVVRLWNTVHSRLVGQFTAHNRDLGSIVMTVSPCGRYLVTADREGTLNTWDIQNFCLESDEGITKEPPKLLCGFRPHLERVTHLEMCFYGDSLLLLSASSDCSVALSYLPGDTVGLFGQEEQWCLETLRPLRPQWEPERDWEDHGGQDNTRQGGKRSPLTPSETSSDPGSDTSTGGEEVGIKDEGEPLSRNLQVLQMETVTLAQESKEMEEKLQQLKESMSKEKEERGHSGGFRWKSGQCVSLNSNAVTNTLKKDKENKLQKLSAGKLKIRVLKDEPLTAPPQPAPPPPPPPIGLRTTRKNRLRGTCCGQCEVKTAGLRCAECTEDYCVGCFAKFHQKGALKLHRMIPIQTDLQTHVSTRDVVSRFQKQINPGSHPGTFTSFNPSSKPSPNRTIKSNVITTQEAQSPEKGSKAVAQTMQFHPDPSQVLVVNQETVEMTEEVQKREDAVGFPASLLRGVYNEEESARSFQEALRQWRGEKSGGRREEPRSEEAMWTPVRPVSVSAMATQADLAPNRGAEGRERGGEEGRVPVRVEFTESNLTYMDRLLLKKNRRY